MTYPGSGGDWPPRPEDQQPGGWPQGGQPPTGPQPTGPQQPYGEQAGQFPGQYPTGPQPTAQYPTGPQPTAQYPNAQYPNAQYPGAQYPNTQYPTGPQPYVQPFNQAPGGQPPTGPGNYWHPQAQPPKRRSGVVIGVIVAVVVLAAGGVGTWIALNRTSAAGGSASPQAAATKLVADVGNSDVLGLVDDLPPAEAGLLRDTISSTTDSLKRLQVVNQNADPEHMSGVKVRTSGITFDKSGVEQVNDHLAITKLVSGTITVSSTMSANQYTDKFLHSAFPSGLPSSDTHTVNIADEVRDLGHPIRIATVQVDGKWFPSLFYSIADAGLQAAHKPWPSQSIPAVGADSADDAVRQFVQALLDADFKQAIELTAPDEMGALHDAGQAILDSAGRQDPSGLKIDSVTFDDRSVAGGTDAVLQTMTVEMQGEKIDLKQSGDCFQMQDESSGEQQKFCASDFAKQVGSDDDMSFLPPEFTKLLQDMAAGMIHNSVGLVATQVDGKWYVSPGRTVSQLVLSMFSGITSDDLTAILQMEGGH